MSKQPTMNQENEVDTQQAVRLAKKKIEAVLTELEKEVQTTVKDVSLKDDGGCVTVHIELTRPVGTIGKRGLVFFTLE